MVSFIKHILLVLLGTLVLVAVLIGLNHFYPDLLPAKAKSMLDVIEAEAMQKVAAVLPSAERTAEQKMKALSKENARIAREERDKLQRIAQESAQYAFDKAFNAWYIAPQECQNPQTETQKTECVDHRRAAKRDFQAEWDKKFK